LSAFAAKIVLTCDRFVCGNNVLIISTDEDPGLRIESFAVTNLCGVSTNKTIIYFIAMQTYKELIVLTCCYNLNIWRGC
jgi:hypothetical protein